MTENNNNFLPKEKQDQAIKWLNDKWKNQICECCGGRDWTLNGHLTTPINFQQGAFHFGGMAYPSLGVVCKNCGNTKHFNAVAMGLVDGAKKGEEDGKK